MAEWIVKSKAPLRPDPDEISPALVELAAGVAVLRQRELATWSKVSVASGSLTGRQGWLPSEVLAQRSLERFQLFDEPFGAATDVEGEIVETGPELPPWRKVRIRKTDGTDVKGWIETSATPADGGGTDKTTIAEPAAAGLSLGANEIYRAALLTAEQRTGIDAAALAALIDAEAAPDSSGRWKSDSQAGASSAAGLTQFLDDTWIQVARTKGTLLNEVGRSKGLVGGDGAVGPGMRSELLRLRFDPTLSIVSAAEYGAANLSRLIAQGVVDEEVGDDEKARLIYLAHHEGPAGAKAFLDGTANYTFSDLVTQVGRDAAPRFVEAAHGDTTKAYRAWLNGYMDRKIQPSRFRKAGAQAQSADVTRPLSELDGAPLPIAELGGKAKLVKAIQWRLYELGYLDPPADGVFGPVSNWALDEFCDRNGVSLADGLTKAVAQKLLSPSSLLPEVAPTGTWFDKVAAYMKAQGYFVCRHPKCRNIVYLEGANPDGTLNDDAPNMFNDLRIVFSLDETGRPVFLASVWEGTTEPGRFWTLNPMNPKGAARIAFNQYKSWAVGVHHAGKPSAHEALVQVAPVSVHRDLNKDFKRTGDAVEIGLFAINQHWGYDAPRDDLGRSSAGCLVGRSKDGHREFMRIVKDDPRFKVNRSYRFVTAVMPGDAVLGQATA